MSDKKEVPTISLITPPFIISLPTLLTARKYKDPKTGREGLPKFSTQMIFESADMTKFKRPKADNSGWEDVELRPLLMEMAKAMWPGIELKDLFPKSAKTGDLKGWPIRKGDNLAAALEARKKGGEKLLEALRGRTVLSAQTGEGFPPKLKHKVSGKKVELDREKETAKIKKLFSGGNYAYAALTFKPYEVDEKYSITTYLNDICFIKEGISFGGGSLMDKFDGIEGGESDLDVTAGIDDDFGEGI